jgi:hypothetical protein
VISVSSVVSLFRKSFYHGEHRGHTGSERSRYLRMVECGTFW